MYDTANRYPPDEAAIFVTEDKDSVDDSEVLVPSNRITPLLLLLLYVAAMKHDAATAAAAANCWLVNEHRLRPSCNVVPFFYFFLFLLLLLLLLAAGL